MKKSRFIYIAGCDGTGKTTQAKLLLKHLEEEGLEPVHLWLRFPFMLSVPLLAFARMRGYSKSEVIDEVKYGYWEFGGSRLLRTLLPWTLLADAAIASIKKVYLPLMQGRTIVCERYVLDMLADLETAFGDNNLHNRLPGKLYAKLIPRGGSVMMLDLDAKTIRERRADLLKDRKLEARLAAFRSVAGGRKYKVFSSSIPVAALQQDIRQLAGV